MKKIQFILLAVSTILVASCVKEEHQEVSPNVNLIPMSFTVGSEGTKVQLQDDKSIHWEVTDKVKVYDGISTELEPFETTESGSKVVFNGNVSNGSTEHYAVYPHSAAKGFDATNKTLSITLPETQTASAGNVPSNAFISVAKADAEKNLAFKNVTAFVKFSLSDATDIKSVTISGNAGESLTGDMTVTIGENGIPSNAPTANMNYTATLSGKFESQKDYYIAIRSAAFSKGITVSIYKNNGTQSSRAYLSSKDAPSTTITRNTIFDLKELNVDLFKSTAPADQFLAYLHGYNVEIGDYKLHKTSGIKPKLVTATKVGHDFKTEFNGISGDILLFLDQNKEYSFTIGSLSDIKGNVRLIGRKASSKVSLTTKSYIRLISGSLYAKNLVLSQNNTEGYITNNATTSQDFENLYFDDCVFSDLNKNIFYNSVSGYGISNISLTDCDIKISSNVTLFKEGEVTTEKMTVSNNVIYSADGNYLYILDGVGTATVTNLTYTRNSLINCYPNANSYIFMKTGTTANLSNNLFHLPDYAVKSGSTYRGILRTASQASNPTNATVAVNHCHRLNAQDGVTMNSFKASFYDFSNLSNTMSFNSENLFDNGTYDIDNGIFVSGKSAYGAIR